MLFSRVTYRGTAAVQQYMLLFVFSPKVKVPHECSVEATLHSSSNALFLDVFIDVVLGVTVNDSVSTCPQPASTAGRVQSGHPQPPPPHTHTRLASPCMFAAVQRVQRMTKSLRAHIIRRFLVSR